MRALVLSPCLLLLAAPALCAQADTAPPAVTHWMAAPAVFPKGAFMAAVSGDPAKAEMFTVKLALPPGYKIPPHFHPSEEKVKVEHGTLLVGMGDKFDRAKMKPMKVGESGSIPAKAHHFAAAESGTVVSITAMGPFAMTYVHAADDPSKQAAK